MECRENRREKPFGVLRTSGGFLCAALTGGILYWPVYERQNRCSFWEGRGGVKCKLIIKIS